MMDPRTGLLPGQAWNVAAGPTWQARLCRAGRAHVIGRELAGHPEYDEGYTDPRRVFATAEARVAADYRRCGMRVPRFARPRPWHTFERACRAARMHSRMVIAAKRQAAQAGRGGVSDGQAATVPVLWGESRAR